MMSLASPLGVHGSSPGSSKDLNPLETDGERLPLRLTLGDREGDAFDRAWRHFLNVAPVTDGAVSDEDLQKTDVQRIPNPAHT